MPMKLHASCLATEGPFDLLNALRPLNAGATHSLHISFWPHIVHQVRLSKQHCLLVALTVTSLRL